MNQIFDSIADGLAELGYAVVDQFLSQDEVDAILRSGEFAQGITNFTKSGIGQRQGFHINETVRGDYILWIDREIAEPAVKIYLDRLTALVQHLNQTLFLSLKDFEVHMTIYPAGSFYKRHLDQFKNGGHRKLSVICYLNNAWEEKHGGQLRMYLKSGVIDVLPMAGRLVCFRSDQIEHEVLAATRDRLSLTGWILDQLVGLRHL